MYFRKYNCDPNSNPNPTMYFRKCNCDANDSQIRADAGVITHKDYIPIGTFVTADKNFGSINVTAGPIYCADKPLGES